MPVRHGRILSGWRARCLVRAGGLIVRDGAAFRVHQWADERSRHCGRLPAHVVARLKAAELLAVFRGDPDRLVQAPDVPVQPPRPVNVSPAMSGKAPASLLEQMEGDGASCVRLRAAAGRFQADYHLAASPGRLRTDDPRLLAAAHLRLLEVEDGLGADMASMAEMLVLDRFTQTALRHATGAGLSEAEHVLRRLAAAYGLLRPDQAVGKAFASS
jgi:hypothetical protein